MYLMVYNLNCRCNILFLRTYILCDFDVYHFIDIDIVTSMRFGLYCHTDALFL